MKINLLEKGYRDNEDFYTAFLSDDLWNSEYVSDESIWIDNPIPDFPIYFSMRVKDSKKEKFIEAIKCLDQNVIGMDRDYYMNERFWHSLLCLYKREYLLDEYPEIKKDFSKFRNIVLKKFDWENYIYKAILIAQYVDENRADEKEKYYHIILDNMDMFNYIIKYEIFRNGTFMINIMDIIDETGLSLKLKEKIRNRPDLGKDERYGRRVILELNKSYPIVMSPMLEKDELKKYFLRFLSMYTEYDDGLSNDMLSDTHEDSIHEDGVPDQYKRWLYDKGLDSDMADYIEDIAEYMQKEKKLDFYRIKEADEVERIIKNLPIKYKMSKYRMPTRNYLQFLIENNS